MESVRSVETPRRLQAINAERQAQGHHAQMPPPFDPHQQYAQHQYMQQQYQQSQQAQPFIPASNTSPLVASQPQGYPPGIPQWQTSGFDFVMPTPRMPIVEFRFRDSDEAAYAVILRRGDRTLDLGVFAPNHRTIQQKDGVRHYTDPDMVRLAEHISGTWREMPATEELLNLVGWLQAHSASQDARLANLESACDALIGQVNAMQQAAPGAAPDSTEFVVGDEFDQQG